MSTPSRSESDIAVVGAGPAGLAAALAAAGFGCTVTLIDSGPAIGGQIYRQSLLGARPRGGCARRRGGAAPAAPGRAAPAHPAPGRDLGVARGAGARRVVPAPARGPGPA